MRDSDPAGALRDGAEEDLGGRGVRVLLEEVVLDLPDVVVAESIGERDLVKRVPVNLGLRLARRDLELID